MWYLFIEIWLWLLVAFILGWAASWFLCCKEKDHKTSTVGSNVAVQNTTAKPKEAAVAPAVNDSWKPQGFAARPDSVDDLKRIKGVGAVIEKTLHELGVYQFNQVAKWDANNIRWIENFLAFPGRINREDWTNQAKTLSDGGTTDFSKRVDKGDVNYKG